MAVIYFCRLYSAEGRKRPSGQCQSTGLSGGPEKPQNEGRIHRTLAVCQVHALKNTDGIYRPGKGTPLTNPLVAIAEVDNPVIVVTTVAIAITTTERPIPA